MISKDVNINKTRNCSACGRKMHHGYKGIALINQRGKVKAYACSDTCSNAVVANHG